MLLTSFIEEPLPSGPAIRSGGGDDLEHRLCLGKVGLITADHEGKLAGGGGARIAAHLALEHADVLLGQSLADAAGGDRVDGAEVDQHSAGGEGVDHAVTTGNGLLDIARLGEHGYHVVGFAGGSRR